jgi:hypothetical protein
LLEHPLHALAYRLEGVSALFVHGALMRHGYIPYLLCKVNGGGVFYAMEDNEGALYRQGSPPLHALR